MREVKAIYLKEYKKPSFSIESVNLIFELGEEETLVTNSMKINKEDKQEKHLRLDSVDLELIELYLNDIELHESRYIIEDESLSILNVPTSFTLKVVNKIYPDNNTELEGLYKSGSIFCTQNEPEGFRRITPYLDRPDIMSVFTTTIIADKERYPVLLSNGNRRKYHNNFDKRHSITWVDPHKKPSYLFALVAGDLGSISDEYMTASGERIELNIYCDIGNESKCHHAMKSLKEAMRWDEEVYAREYDLEIYNIVAVDSFNMGAMENKGLNIFNSAYVLADTDTATDANFMAIESVIAHEYFHNWTGNRITCRDWFQLTLKEGLTVFRDQSFSADLNSTEVQRIKDVKELRERQFVEDASPTAHPIQPESYISMNNFYTSTVYEKGAEVIRMIHTLLGEKNYSKATDLYFKSFDGQAVTIDDFLWAMSKASGKDLTQFKNWYHQSGTPRLKVEESFEDGVYSLILTQNIPDGTDGSKQKPFYYPLKIALLGEKGVELVNDTLIISKESETFVYGGLHEKPILSINRDFSAPIIVDQKNVNFAFLMQYDQNSFIKYEATQSFAIETLEAMMQGKEIDPLFVASFGNLLDLDINLSYKALLLELPSVSTLMQRQKQVDFEPIYVARERLLKHLACTFEKKLLLIYKENHTRDIELDSHSMAKRSLKNRVLSILASLENEEIEVLVQRQYEESKSMSDRVVALEIQINSFPSLAKVALHDFYNKYKEETLVMSKYLSLVASCEREGTLSRVVELQNDRIYDEKVPNLVRSLIGAFARNYKHFHAKDGSGYTFVADKIIEIDRINAQIASGLAGAFKIYSIINKTNKTLMYKELKRVVSTHGLSKNSYEIISKTLK